MIKAFEGNMPVIDETAFIAEGTQIVGKIVIKQNASIWYNSVVRGDVNTITIGENSNIQDGCAVHCDSDFPTVIGDNVTVGHNVIIHGCSIDEFCIIGMGSTLLDGVKIGKNSIVGANSLVTQNKVFPEGVLIIGSPAKVLRELTAEEIEGIRISVKGYVELKNLHMK